MSRADETRVEDGPQGATTNRRRLELVPALDICKAA